MSKKHKTYTTEFKAEAIKLIEANQGNVSETARQLSISMQTLSNWNTKAKAGTLAGTKQYSPDLNALLEENKKLKHMLDKSTEELLLHIKAVSELSASNVTALERNSNISLKNQISILKDNLKTIINMNQAATNKGFWWVCIVLFLNVIATIVVFLGVFG